MGAVILGLSWPVALAVVLAVGGGVFCSGPDIGDGSRRIGAALFVACLVDLALWALFTFAF